MDVTNLTSLVTALRAETAYAAITPESLGGLLQKIVDAIGKTSSDDDMKVVQNWKTALQQITHVITSAEQGTADRNNIYLTVQLASLATGATGTNTDAILIRQATTERAGAMRAQQVIDLNTCKSDIKNLQSGVTALEKKVENLPTSGSSSSSSSAVAYRIVADVRDDVLYIRGASKLIAAGYKPFIFRYSVKRNRHTNKQTGQHFRGPKRRGWHMFYGEKAAKVNSNESISFANMDSNGKPTTNYGTSVWNIFNLACHYDEDTGDTDKIKVGWGKKTIDATKGRRFKMGIAFAPPQKKQGFDNGTLVTNIAEFHALVQVHKLTGKPMVSLCL